MPIAFNDNRRAKIEEKQQPSASGENEKMTNTKVKQTQTPARHSKLSIDAEVRHIIRSGLKPKAVQTPLDAQSAIWKMAVDHAKHNHHATNGSMLRGHIAKPDPKARLKRNKKA